MKQTSKEFGEHNGNAVTLFTLENNNGMMVKLMDYGATITSISIPGKGGKPISLACGFDKFEDYFSEEYKANSPYFGCTVGRYCSQIKNATFELDGQSYQLAKMVGENNLHGGTVGFDKKMWKSEPIETNDKVGVLFSQISDDMEEGFPGSVAAAVEISLNNQNEITINYKATTTKPTPLSMTNHTYFNLSGFETSVEDFKVKVFTNKLQGMDDTGAGTGEIKDVTGTIEDLRDGRIIKDVHAEVGGFEHFYVFDNTASELNQTAEITDRESGRKLEVYSTEPCMLFYTGKYTSDELKRNDSERYGQYRGFCCETHRWQNGPNIENSPNTITRPDKEFTSTTVFKISF